MDNKTNGNFIVDSNFYREAEKLYMGNVRLRAAHIKARQMSAGEVEELREQVRKLREGVGEIANYGTFLTADDAYEMNELAKQLLKETEG